MDYTTLGKLLQEKRLLLGYKQSDIAGQLGCTSANISSWERGKSKIDIDSLLQLCDIYKLDFSKTLEQLNNNYGGQYNTTKLTENEHIRKYNSLDEFGKEVVDSVLDIEYRRCSTQVNMPKIVHLPKSILKPSAGVGNWLDEQQLESVSVVDTPTARKANLILEVDGDSMSPMYKDGDNVFVNTNANVEIGDIGIFIVDNSGYIKKLGTDRLISVNTEYDDIIPAEYSECRCVGKVLGKAEIVG